jgi:hypothetical protein
VKVESEAKKIIGIYGPHEHKACIQLLPNGIHVNCVFEKSGITYAMCLVPGTESSIEALKKKKADAIGKSAAKRAKVEAKKKADQVKIIMPKWKSGLKRPYDTELALAKPMNAKKIHF